jgi:nucleoprotein TPR
MTAEGGKTTATMTTTTTTTTTAVADQIEVAARRAAASLNREALLSAYESNYAAIEGERDGLRRRLAERDAEANERSAERDRLAAELKGAREELRRRGEEATAADAAASSERARHSETRAELELAGERADRMDREADGLRAEITRLARTNEESAALLGAMANQHSRSSGEAAPLRLQVRRLEQELDAVSSHSNYLDGELSNRNDEIASLKRDHSAEVRALRSELDGARLALERTERDLTSARLVNDRTSRDVERSQGRMRDAELAHASRREMLERDLDKERELAALKEQRALLAEDRCAALAREMTELKELAREATEGATAHAEEARVRLAGAIGDAVRAAREEEGRKLEESEERVRHATEARARMEEIILGAGSPRRRVRTIEGGGDGAGDPRSPMLLLESAGGGDGPLGLTDLYSRLAEAEDDLRSERRENQKLKIIIDRIQRDVAAKTPMIRQWQLEHESALEELEVTNERLHYARREVTDIRADNQELEMLNGRLERECAELKRENVDLATQVQSLLQRRCAESAGDMVSFDDITSLQQQNQKLLRDHYSMTANIAELEDKIRNDPDAIELKSLRLEVGSLREEREKQATLVAGIVHQRDLYRALVAKNDAPLIAYEGQGQDHLALVDVRAEHLPIIEARNNDLVEEVAKLKAEVSCCKHEQVALEGRLARVDAHANELTTSNERLRGDLTTAKATVARLEIDVSHYQGRTERLENSLAMVKSECESESRRKAQTEELLSKTQAHLEAVRSELAKKEQQYQQVRRLRCGVENIFISKYAHSLMVYSGYISDHRLRPR